MDTRLSWPHPHWGSPRFPYGGRLRGRASEATRDSASPHRRGDVFGMLDHTDAALGLGCPRTRRADGVVRTGGSGSLLFVEDQFVVLGRLRDCLEDAVRMLPE